MIKPKLSLAHDIQHTVTQWFEHHKKSSTTLSKNAALQFLHDQKITRSPNINHTPHKTITFTWSNATESLTLDFVGKSFIAYSFQKDKTHYTGENKRHFVLKLIEKLQLTSLMTQKI